MVYIPDLSGRRVLITGANSGTGLEATRRLLQRGAHVTMAVRNLEKGNVVRERLETEIESVGSVRVMRVDLSDLVSVRQFSAALLADGDPLDTLINNAGIVATGVRRRTADGFEKVLATNFLGPFALTISLLPLLLKGENPRVASMSSNTATFGHINFKDLHSRGRYLPTVAYAQSKLAVLLMGAHLARTSAQRGWGLRSVLAHPGHTRTAIQEQAGTTGPGRHLRAAVIRLLPSMSVEEGTGSLIVAATDATAVNGGYYGPRRNLSFAGPVEKLRLPRSARSVDLGASLWAVAESLTGVRLSA